MNTLTTHVLDIAAGIPAAGMRIDFSILEKDSYRFIKTVRTDGDGRAPAPLLDEHEMKQGRYELMFHVGEYFERLGQSLADPPFLDTVPVRFAIARTDQHYHVPLLVSPWSYTTYRGS